MYAEEFNKRWLPLSDGFYRVAYYILESADDAQDAVQDLYIKLWKSKNAAILNPKAYGMTLLKNICVDKIRHKSSNNCQPLNDILSNTISSPDDTVDQIIDKEEINSILSQIDKLPGNQSKILKMRFVEDLDYEEISKRTGLSQQNIRVVVSNARKQLKRSND